MLALPVRFRFFCMRGQFTDENMVAALILDKGGIARLGQTMLIDRRHNRGIDTLAKFLQLFFNFLEVWRIAWHITYPLFHLFQPGILCPQRLCSAG